MIGETSGKHPRFWTVEDHVDHLRTNIPGAGIEVVGDDTIRLYSEESNIATPYFGTKPPQMDSEVTFIQIGDMQDSIMSPTIIPGEIVE